jgi:alkaline phosphatase
MKNKIISIGITTLLLVGCFPNSQQKNKPIEERPLNIILMIGDGMGPAHIKAYRKFMDDPKTVEEEKVAFDYYLVGSLSTESSDTRENITDSAAAATAFSTGKRTINDALSVDEFNQPIKTVFEKAKEIRLSTGLVVTSQVVHATPAAFVSHHINRKKYNEIADQYFDNQINDMPLMDVLLGGGTKYFIRNDRNLVSEFTAKGYDYVENKSQLNESISNKLIGLFGKISVDKMWDRDSWVPSLADMTKAAIKRLDKNDKGFLLMVEASKIDWAAHEKDIVGVMSEMQDFELALKAAIQYAKADGNTLVIVTADHETGGLSVGSGESGEKFYYWDHDVIRSFKYTTAKIASDAQKSGSLLAEVQKATTLKLTEKEKHQLNNADLKDWYQTRRVVTNIINKRSFTGWTTFVHTGVDVNLYAYGPGSEQLRGHWDNTKIGKTIFQWLDAKE